MCTACAGSFLLEFGTLSVLTDNFEFFRAAKVSAVKLFHARNADTNLVGRHIHNGNGAWTQSDCSLGTFVDSYLEYLAKAHLLFGDDDLRLMLHTLWPSLWFALSEQFGLDSTFYTEVRLSDAAQTSATHDTFASFWPSVLALNGHLRLATQFLDSVIEHIVEPWLFVPEMFDLKTMRPSKGRAQYFLRPELVESLFHLHSATADAHYLDTAWTLLKNINDTARVDCGFATIADIEKHTLKNSMDSFWLSETLKYFYLLFAVETPQSLRGMDLLFTTEGHLLPLRILRRKWDAQLRARNSSRRAFLDEFHWWNLEPFWPRMFEELRDNDKLSFLNSGNANANGSTHLLRNFFKFIGNDHILYSEYQRLMVKKDSKATLMRWDVRKLQMFRDTVYDTANSAFYEKTFETNGRKYADEWVAMGAAEFWDCGQRVQTRTLKNGAVIENWSLHNCDSYVHSKCWAHRLIDNQTCWV